jgi:succinoglycan biosynthesis protein ExoA
MTAPLPLASVLVPTLNEAAHIEGVLRNLLQQAPGTVLEIIVADGGSTDGTREIVERLGREEPRIRLLHNPGRIQAVGVNLAARAAHPAAEALIRVDAHSSYPPEFVSRLLRTLEEREADSVVIRLWTEGAGCFGKAVAATSNDFLGTGGAEHRMGRASRWVDHGHHAAFRRSAFEATGGYDETFRTNEDAEFDVRLRAQGGRIWFAADIVVQYHPRETARALAVQYFRYGAGRAANVLKHRGGLRLRQCAPVALLLGNLTALALSPLHGAVLLAPGGYLAAVAALSVYNALQTRSLCVLGAMVAAPVMHHSWAAGFLVRFAKAAGDGLVKKRRAAWADGRAGRWSRTRAG